MVIVTYSADWWQFKFLMQTLNHFAIEPQTVLVILNEPDTVAERLQFEYLQKNRKLCRKRHRVDFLKAGDLIANINWSRWDDGWIWQQILKIIVSERVRSEDYVLLDSKNFFVAPFTAGQIFNSQPNALLGYCEDRIRTAQRYCDLFGVHDKGEFMHNITPFVMKTATARRLTQHFGSTQAFADWFWSHCWNTDDEWTSPMEFCLYDVFSHSIGQFEQQFVPCNYSTLWDHMLTEYGWSWKDCVKEIRRLRKEGCVVSGLHKSFIEQSTPEECLKIMASLGLFDLFLPFQKDLRDCRNKLLIQKNNHD